MDRKPWPGGFMRIDNRSIALLILVAASVRAFAGEDAVVQLKDDPCRRLVLENEKVRVWEVDVPIGASCPFHEHKIDMVSVRINGTEMTNQPKGGLFNFSSDWTVEAGSMQFSEYDNSPYIHRIVPKGPLPHRVVEFELLKPPGASPLVAARPGFANVFDKARARAVRAVLEPSKSMDVATPANTLLVVVKGGVASPKELRTADIQWFGEPSQRTIRNDGMDPIEWVEIEVK
jgi:hypothetical protein